MLSLSVNLSLLGLSGVMSATISANFLNIRDTFIAVNVNNSLEHVCYVRLDTGVLYGDSLFGVVLRIPCS